MYYIIREITLDIANKYRVRVSIDEDSAVFFKFDHYPTQDEINIMVEDYLNNQKSNIEMQYLKIVLKIYNITNGVFNNG